MLKFCQISILFLTLISMAKALNGYSRHSNTNKTINFSVSNQQTPKLEVTDDALFLTPYIEQGQIQKAQQLATVQPMLENVESFSGYLTVNKTAGSNLFFWLFKSQTGNWEQRPLVVWLQGGPGWNSLYGLFTENGPFLVTQQQTLVRRKYSWNRKYNLLYIDQPVGSGFSFTKMDSGYAKNEDDVARDLYEAIVQLYKLFPSLQQNKLIITGESYAGKYIPAIAYKISKQNKVSTFKIKLSGLMIGNGHTDPINMLDQASVLYNLGLIDGRTRDEITKIQDQTKAYIQAGEYIAAADEISKATKEIMAVTGFKRLDDFTELNAGAEGPEEIFYNSPKTRKAIHVGSHISTRGMQTLMHLKNDLYQSSRPLVEKLLTAAEFPVMFYSGQLDIITAYEQSVEFYDALEWPYAEEYYNAKRCQFKVGNEVAGYYKTAGTFTEVLVRNAGHQVPTKQPKWAYELMDRFVTDSKSFKCE